MFSLKTRTGRSAASFVYTSANITLAQPVLPAIDSKTFTDYGPLLSPSQVRTVPLSPDSVKRWAHFHRDGSLGAWSCLCDIIAQMFGKVNLTPVPKWVWERNCKIFFQFSRCFRNLINQQASILSTYKDAFKNTVCSTWAKIFSKFTLLLIKRLAKTHFLSLSRFVCKKFTNGHVFLRSTYKNALNQPNLPLW